TLTLMVGGIRLLMGFFRLGFVVNFLSRPVINGFTSAAAIVIGLSQIRHLLKIDLPQTGHIQDMLIALGTHINQIHWPTLGVGLVWMLVIMGGKKIHRLFPSLLMAVVVGTLAVWAFDLNEYGIETVGKIPGGIPNLSIPSYDFSLLRQLFPLALTIALIGF